MRGGFYRHSKYCQVRTKSVRCSDTKQCNLLLTTKDSWGREGNYGLAW